MLAPAKTPRPIIDRLNSEIVKILKSPEMKKRLASLGLDPVANTPEEFQKFIESENVKWAKIAKETNAKSQ